MSKQPYQPEYLANALVKPRDPKLLLGVLLYETHDGFYYAYQEPDAVIFFTKHICAN